MVEAVAADTAQSRGLGGDSVLRSAETGTTALDKLDPATVLSATQELKGALQAANLPDVVSKAFVAELQRLATDPFRNAEDVDGRLREVMANIGPIVKSVIESVTRAAEGTPRIIAGGFANGYDRARAEERERIWCARNGVAYPLAAAPVGC